MDAQRPGWGARLLMRLLREDDGPALLGDLAEEQARRSSAGVRGAARWCTWQLYSSLLAVLWLRGLEFVRAMPWGTAAAAYVVVGCFELGSLQLLSRLWPEVAHPASALRLVVEFPGIAAIAYAAARVHGNAAYVLGGMMLLVAVLLLSISDEVLSGIYVVAFLTVGPLAALLGGVLHRGRRTAASTVVALLVVSGSASAQGAKPMIDPSKTTYGEKSPRAPRELDVFAFLIGTWEGRGRTKLPDGQVAEYPVRWVGRYILDGTAIADDAHGPTPDGKPYVGISFRQYDDNRATWIIEYLAVSDSFLRRQVHPGAGSVIVTGRNVTVAQEAPGMSILEHYLVQDSDNWMYRLDLSSDGGRTWNEGTIEFTLRRSQ